MKRFSLFARSASFSTLAVALLAAAGPVRAQQGGTPDPVSPGVGATAAAPTTDIAQEPETPDVAEEVVVTGTLLRGPQEGAALTVDVFTAEELERRGNPTLTELIKALPASAGVIGEANQFPPGRGSGAEGQGSVNLRGFGPERTLVLLNGKRMPTTAAEQFVDVYSIPVSAIGRLEVLKDGAGATYGSDAVAGVVNFITRRDLRGFEVGGTYRLVPGSNGDVDANIAWGWKGDRVDVLLAGGFQHRSKLRVLDRDWAIESYNENPQGGWTGGGSPGIYAPVIGFSRVGPALADPACRQLGGVLTGPVPIGAAPAAQTPSGFNTCRTQFIGWDNLVEKTTRFQLFGEVNVELSDTIDFHLDALYAQTRVPRAGTSPSFVPTRGVTATVLPAGITGLNNASNPPTLGAFYVPGTNPGFLAFQAANPGYFPAGTNGVLLPLGQWRPFLAGGNPLFDGGPGFLKRDREAFRVSAGVEARLPDGLLGTDVRLSAGALYGEYTSSFAGRDSVTGRLQLALRGLGGPDCPYLTGTPGVGPCQYLNPFSNGIPGNGLTGEPNPGFVPSLQPSKELTDWFFAPLSSSLTNEIQQYDLTLSGTSGLKLPGGPVRWAVGLQARRGVVEVRDDSFTSSDRFPCADTPINGSTQCFPTPTSVFVFTGSQPSFRDSQNVKAIYGEVAIPVLDRLDVNLSARFEDYGDKGGETFNPQARARFEIVDGLSVRGSVGSTFRAPPLRFLQSDAVVTLANVFGTFIPVDVANNPDLKPEKADIWSAGAVFERGTFRLSADYWRYKFTDLITDEPLNSVLAAGFPAAGGACTGDPAFVASRFEFSSGCSSGTLTKVITSKINGPSITTSGVDVLLDYRLTGVAGGSLGLGGSVTYIERYKVSALEIGGVPVPGSAFDGVGKANFGTIAYPLPQWKATGYLEFERGAHSIRWDGRFTDSYEDQRAGLFVYSSVNQTATAAACGGPTTTTPRPTVSSPECGTVTRGRTIKSILLHDLTYRAEITNRTTLVLNVANVLDSDPPFARTELSYDALTGDPLGRTFRLSVRQRF